MDDTLRELERRWRETATAEDEAAYLSALVRSGGLSLAGIQLAAHCRHAAAMRMLASDEGLEVSPADAESWARGFGRFGRPVCVRVCAAVACELYDAWVEACPDENDPVRETLAALRTWLSDADAGAEAAAHAQQRFANDAMQYDEVCYTEAGAETAAYRSWEAAACLVSALQSPQFSPYPLEDPAEACVRAVEQLGAPANATSIVASYLTPWALGRGDPIAEFVHGHLPKV